MTSSEAPTVRSSSKRSRRSSIPTLRSPFRVGTRESALALRQAELAIDAMRFVEPTISYEIVTISTLGDRDKTTPIEQLGAKAVFAHELQQALVDGRIDVAIHSAKDLTGAEPEELRLAAFLEREDARDVLISRTGEKLAELPPGAVVGTSSLRRGVLITRLREDLRTVPLRGNVDTRLRKVADGEMDAAVLAAAGVVRLGRSDEITEWLDPDEFVPPPGQGAIVIESRARELDWLERVDHVATRECVMAERAFMQVVEGSCDMPLGAWVTKIGEDFRLKVFVSSRDGRRCFRYTAFSTTPEDLGVDVARAVLAEADLHR